MEKVENWQFSCKMENRIQKMQKKPQTKQTCELVHGVKKVCQKKSVQQISPEDLFSVHADFQ